MSYPTARPGWSATAPPNTAVVITLPQATIRGRYKIGQVSGWYSDTPTDGLLTVMGGGFNVSIPVTAAGAGFIPLDEKSDGSSDIVITLAAGGAGIVGYVNLERVEVTR